MIRLKIRKLSDICSEKYDFLALPVVDKDNRLVGIVTFDDAMDVIQDENTEDFSKMAAIAPNEESYFRTGIFKHAKSRIVWLLILMISATITQIITNRYEAAFAAVPLLVSFMPMIMDTGGNCGAQSSTLIIRGIALDEIHFVYPPLKNSIALGTGFLPCLLQPRTASCIFCLRNAGTRALNWVQQSRQNLL